MLLTTRQSNSTQTTSDVGSGTAPVLAEGAGKGGSTGIGETPPAVMTGGEAAGMPGCVGTGVEGGGDELTVANEKPVTRNSPFIETRSATPSAASGSLVTNASVTSPEAENIVSFSTRKPVAGISNVVVGKNGDELEGSNAISSRVGIRVVTTASNAVSKAPSTPPKMPPLRSNVSTCPGVATSLIGSIATTAPRTRLVGPADPLMPARSTDPRTMISVISVVVANATIGHRRIAIKIPKTLVAQKFFTAVASIQKIEDFLADHRIDLAADHDQDEPQFG